MRWSGCSSNCSGCVQGTLQDWEMEVSSGEQFAFELGADLPSIYEGSYWVCHVVMPRAVPAVPSFSTAPNIQVAACTVNVRLQSGTNAAWHSCSNRPWNLGGCTEQHRQAFKLFLASSIISPSFLWQGTRFKFGGSVSTTACGTARNLKRPKSHWQGPCTMYLQHLAEGFTSPYTYTWQEELS